MKKRFKQAFTLVEMMIVMLIVSIVLAASGPMLAKREEKILTGSIPAGTIISYAGNITMLKPIPSGWLLCDGHAVLRTTYPALFSAIGTTYGAGDGSTTFNLPDLRGEFIRGFDNGRGVDSGRTLGSWQKGTITIVDPSYTSVNISAIIAKQDWRNSDDFAPEAGYDIAPTSDYPNVLRVSHNAARLLYPDRMGMGELLSDKFGFGATRPRNVAMNYIIKH
jgi:prepilin-type N-terminal cleavage/methylation domain-containing protein